MTKLFFPGFRGDLLSCFRDDKVVLSLVSGVIKLILPGFRGDLLSCFRDDKVAPSHQKKEKREGKERKRKNIVLKKQEEVANLGIL